MRRILSVILILIFTAGIYTQQLKIKKISLKKFPLIELGISIESKWGAPIPIDLKQLKFFENDVEITDFKVLPHDTLKVPIYTVIVLDKSGSMKGDPISGSKGGAVEFVKMMQGGDKAAYVEFDDNVKVVSGFSEDKNMLVSFIEQTEVNSNTALLDAVHKGVELFENVPAQSVRIVLALTDGKENRSSKTIEDIYNIAVENEVSIFTIGLGKEIDTEMLTEIASRTQGNYYSAPAPEDLLNVYKKISLLLHSQLTVKFRTELPMDEKWHQLKFKVPHMGKDLEGSKGYLSAKESRISSELLAKINKAQDGSNMTGTGETGSGEITDTEKKKEEDMLIYILLGLSVLLLIILVIVIAKKRK